MAITPGGNGPRFPGFDVLGQVGTWDAETTQVVLGRLKDRRLRFFTEDEEQIVGALVDRLLAQDDEPRIPVVEMIDSRLAERSGDGYRYQDMPEDPEAWRVSIASLEDDAMVTHGRGFRDLERRQQLRLIEKVRADEGQWHGLPAQRVFSLWIRYACTAFYSHPWAWNEIGFGGPAYPRGYKNLGFDRREPWEVADVDGADPVPWAQRAQAVRRRHAEALAERESP